MMIALVFIGLKPLEKPSDHKRTIAKPVPPNHRGECCCALMYALNRARQRDGGGGLAFCFKVHKNENFWLRFWLLYYVIVSYAEMLRFCKKKIWSGCRFLPLKGLHCQRFAIFYQSTQFHVPVFYMARDVIILIRANTIRGLLKGVGLKIETFLGPEIATSEASAIWTQMTLCTP